MRTSATILVMCTCGFLGDGTVLERTQLLDNKIEMLLPEGFEPMERELVEQKYPGPKAPTLVYSDDRGTVNIAVNHTKDRVSAVQLPFAHIFFVAVFKSQFPSAKWFRNELTTINGREFFIFDVRTPARDTDVRNIIAGTSLDGRLLIVSFNVTKEREADWLPTGNKIIDSIQIKE